MFKFLSYPNSYISTLNIEHTLVHAGIVLLHYKRIILIGQMLFQVSLMYVAPASL